MWSRKSRQNMHMSQIGTGGIVEKKSQAWTIPEPSSLLEPSGYQNRAACGETIAEPSGLRGDNSGTERPSGGQ